jgi:transposase
MAQGIPQEKAKRVKAQIVLGLPTASIAKQTNVHLRSIQRYKKNVVDYGTLHPPKAPRQGRPSIITAEMEQVLS